MKALLLGCVLATLSFGQGSYLGVGIMQVSPARAQELKLPAGSGIEVTAVSAGGPADTAGLRAGDVITQYNGQRVTGREQFVSLVQTTPTGRQVNLQVIRAGTPQSMTARIGTQPTPAQMAGGIPGQQGPRMVEEPQNFQTWRSPVLGVQVEALQAQLATYFGVTEGVLVRSVAAGSAAARAGIKAGDVITGVGSNKVTTVEDLIGRMQMMTGNTLGLSMMRDRQPISLTVTFEIQCLPVRGATC